MNDVKTVLLVEDNPDDVMLTLRAFKKSGLNSAVEVARDGVEAIQRLFGKDGRSPAPVLPSLVLLDLKLPKIDGVEVLSRIRSEQATRYLPVVMLTSSDDRHDIAHCYDEGANSYIRKPVDFGEFVDMVRQLGGYWLTLNQPHH